MTGKAEPASGFIRFEDLVDRLRTIFVKAGTSEDVAAILARNCAACERDRTLSHGVFRIPGYMASLAAGWVDGKAIPVIEVIGPSYLRIDGRNGFAQPALAQAEVTILKMLD
jgi:delta1-piperideine-2-carboxylate reductase